MDKDPNSDRDLAEAYLTNAAIDVHADGPGFGHRHGAAELAAGHVASERQVWRLCLRARIFSAPTRQRGPAMRPAPAPPVHEDLVRRDFTARGPNQLWSPTSPSTTPTRASSAKSTGRRNTSITEEFGDGNGRLEQEDQRRT